MADTASVTVQRHVLSRLGFAALTVADQLTPDDVELLIVVTVSPDSLAHEYVYGLVPPEAVMVTRSLVAVPPLTVVKPVVLAGEAEADSAPPTGAL